MHASNFRVHAVTRAHAEGERVVIRPRMGQPDVFAIVPLEDLRILEYIDAHPEVSLKIKSDMKAEEGPL
jgi:hypothetical protein